MEARISELIVRTSTVHEQISKCDRTPFQLLTEHMRCPLNMLWNNSRYKSRDTFRRYTCRCRIDNKLGECRRSAHKYSCSYLSTFHHNSSNRSLLHKPRERTSIAMSGAHSDISASQLTYPRSDLQLQIFALSLQSSRCSAPTTPYTAASSSSRRPD